MIKRILSFTLVVSLILPMGGGSYVLAQDNKPAEPPKVFVITPENLRKNLQEGGLSILAAANRVHRAKDSLTLARTRLLPSINLGVLASSMVNPTFILSSVEYLLPFLIPSRWFDLAKAKRLAEAERLAFLVTELNVYSSLYSIYFNLGLDLQTRDYLILDLRDAALLEELVDRAYRAGRASEADLALARSQTLNANVRLTRFRELIVDEKATIRESLGLPITTELRFEAKPVSESSIEGLPLEQAVQLAKEKAPENQQLKLLLESSKFEKWSKIFSFISGASAGSSGGMDSGSASFAFSNLAARGGLNFGFDYFPNVSLSNRNIDELKIRGEELNAEIVRLVESVKGRFDFIMSRYNDTTQSEALLRRVFENEQQRYSNGLIPFSQLVDAQARLRSAGLERLRAETDVYLIRVGMHRILMSDEFSKIKGCEYLPDTPSDDRDGFFKRRRKKKDAAICNKDSVHKRFNDSKPE